VKCVVVPQNYVTPCIVLQSFFIGVQVLFKQKLFLLISAGPFNRINLKNFIP
jgi:hypothetical protein